MLAGLLTVSFYSFSRSSPIFSVYRLELTWRVFGIQAEIFAVCLDSSYSAHLHLHSQSFLPLA